jgi:predicted metal-binding protein
VKGEIRSNWSHAILVCRKCSRKQAKRAEGTDKTAPNDKKGLGGKKGLAKALKKELAAGKGRKAKLGIVEVPCLDICPNRGVVLIDTRTPDQWRIVGPDADLSQLADELAGEKG